MSDEPLAKLASAYRRADKPELFFSMIHELFRWAWSRVGWHNRKLAEELVCRTGLRVLALSQEQQETTRGVLAYRSGDRDRDNFNAKMRALGEIELSRMWRAMYYRNELSAYPRPRIASKEWLTAPLDRPVYRVDIRVDSDMIQAVTEALPKLSVRQRDVAKLRYLDGYDFAEIVREQGAAPAAVALRLYRATKRLVKEIRPSEILPSERELEFDTSWSCDEQRQWAERLWAEVVYARQTRGRPNAGLSPPPEWMKASDDLNWGRRRESPPSVRARLRAAIGRVLGNGQARRSKNSRRASKSLPRSAGS